MKSNDFEILYKIFEVLDPSVSSIIFNNWTLLYSRSQRISYKTLKVYLSGIRIAHLEQGFPNPTDSALLHLVCRGIHRWQGESQSTRLSITINLLQVLKQQIRLNM